MYPEFGDEDHIADHISQDPATDIALIKLNFICRGGRKGLLSSDNSQWAEVDRGRSSKENMGEACTSQGAQFKTRTVYAAHHCCMTPPCEAKPGRE
jgi:hypothetical protein